MVEQSYVSAAELRKRKVNGKSTTVAFNIGDCDHLATDGTTGEWWWRVSDTRFFGPYTSRRAAAAAWKACGGYLADLA